MYSFNDHDSMIYEKCFQKSMKLMLLAAKYVCPCVWSELDLACQIFKFGMIDSYESIDDLIAFIIWAEKNHKEPKLIFNVILHDLLGIDITVRPKLYSSGYSYLNKD